MALEEDSRDALQHPDNEDSITSGGVTYYTFTPPVKRPRIEIQDASSAKMAIKFNVKESESDPPTATDYHTLLHDGFRNDIEMIKEPLVHTISILSIGAVSTWGTHFMIVGHRHRSTTG